MTTNLATSTPAPSIYDMMARAANLNVTVAIERAVLRHQRERGQAYDDACLEAARTRLKAEVPLFIKTIEVHGTVCRDMYEHAPGFAYFYTQTFRRFDAPAYCSLSRAKVLAAEYFSSLENRHSPEAEDDEEGEYDGRFSPRYIVLKDQFGNVVEERRSVIKGGVYSSDVAWSRDAHEQLPKEEDWPQLLARAAELQSEASRERGWDNFSTAEGLDRHAGQILRSVAIARCLARVVQ